VFLKDLLPKSSTMVTTLAAVAMVEALHLHLHQLVALANLTRVRNWTPACTNQSASRKDRSQSEGSFLHDAHCELWLHVENPLFCELGFQTR
jgi:hypothetical protein